MREYMITIINNLHFKCVMSDYIQFESFLIITIDRHCFYSIC